MMKAVLILLFACLVAVNAQTQPYMMQVNYYAGQQCGDGWMNSVQISAGDYGTCLSYNIPGAGSFNIANCYEEPVQVGPELQYWYETCYCLFFTGDGCTGNNAAYVGMDSNGQALADNNCGTTGQTLQEPVSIKCWWGHDDENWGNPQQS
jgi:hypothetical protein